MTRFRIALFALLVWAAYWAALPWIDRARAMYPLSSGLQLCTFGPQLTFGSTPVSGIPAWGYGPNIAVGIVYLVAAALVGTRRRPM
ncbi:MAG TPA: hypothetical protein VGK15_00220 [Candidatus Limnocylindria bacterium]|jgi:hypothetical protein